MATGTVVTTSALNSISHPYPSPDSSDNVDSKTSTPPSHQKGGLYLPPSLSDSEISQALEQASNRWLTAINSRTTSTDISSSYFSCDYRFDTDGKREEGRDLYFQKLAQYLREHPEHHMTVESCLAENVNVRAKFVAVHMSGYVTGLPPGVVRPCFIEMEWRMREKGVWWLVGHHCVERTSEGF